MVSGGQIYKTEEQTMEVIIMKKSGIFFLALAAALFLAGPSFAGKSKKALSEDDLDRITAAGEPTIIQISDVSVSTSTGDASVEVTFTDDSEADFIISGDAQAQLRALTVNNVIGENQLGNGINVTSTLGGGATQSNNIVQSWGSVKVTDVELELTAVETAATAEATIINASGVLALDKCVGFSCNSTADNSGQTAQADASTTAVALAIAYPEFMSADVIIHIDGADVTAETGDAELSVDLFQNSEASLNLGPGTQTNLAALVLNNVSGKNQVGNGINVASAGGISMTSPGFVIEGIANGVFSVQSNTINQFRGTPINAPQPIAVAIGASDGAVAGFAISGGPGAVVTIP
jgi:hypothetical protein